MKKLMTGNEAIARGAYEAGVKYASAYPGTPSTEILENIALYKDDIVAEWAPNEKVALESAAGGAFAGARTLASMKHVGLNVAADPLFTVAYTGINGGFVVITADEPGMHSSQNEQDNRNYAKSAKVPLLEPSTSQEAKDMMKMAYEISENFNTLVIMRLTTRLCHSKGLVECEDRNEVGIKPYEKVVKRVTVPANARLLRVDVEEREKKLYKFSNETEVNYMEINEGAKVGVISSGMCFNFAKEVFNNNASYLKLGFTNPMPDEKIKEFASKVEKIYIVEENDKFIEEHVKSLGVDCIGKDILPAYGEMTPDVIRKSIFKENFKHEDIDPDLVIPRPPTFCAGCPHRGLFYELGKRKDVVVAGDIGCYTLGFASPYNAMDFVVCMGASLSSAHGCQKVLNMVDGNEKRVIGVLGDSTFFHTGINSLIDVIYNKGNSISIILDNRITGMTGHQQNPTTGKNLRGEPAGKVDLEALCRALGFNRVRVVDPYDLKAVEEAVTEELAAKEPSIIISRRPCVMIKGTVHKPPISVDESKCVGCKQCMSIGCPAIAVKDKKAHIDPTLCIGCKVCSQMCKFEAI